jgi:hypothetical protein
MGAMPATQRLTADEYLARPFSPERRWVQPVEGEEIVDLPLLPHQVLKESWTLRFVHGPVGDLAAASSPRRSTSWSTSTTYSARTCSGIARAERRA